MLEHGGNLIEASRLYGIPIKEWLDLSTGINPRHYPLPEISPALWQSLPQEQDGLAEAASAYYQASAVLPVAGSQAAIQALPRLMPKGLVSILGPTYGEHAHAWQHQGHEVQLLEGLPTAAQLAASNILVVCNPNNPTGRLLPPAQLLQLHAELAKRGGWLVVDEAFMDTMPDYSLASLAERQGLIVLRSLGKFFGLAGARVGFVAAAQPLLAELQEMLGPWPISQPARWIAQQALRDSIWQQEMLEMLATDRLRMHRLLHSYGLTPTAGTALFHYVKTPKAPAIHQHFAARGIWLRQFTQPPALRFGLPPEHGWERLEQALRDWVEASH